MNFFKSILSDEPDPPSPGNPQEPKPSSSISDNESGHSPENRNPNPKPNSSVNAVTSDSGNYGWNFGGFIQTLATRSESVLETYRRDLQEFGSGLKKETVIFRDATSRAVKELPASIEVGASIAHGSLESVGHALDGVIKSTADIISHGKETLLSSSDFEPEAPETSGIVSGSGRYSRFDVQLSSIQNDLNTFCEEPEDTEEYKKWKLGFVFEEMSEEVENLRGENGALEGVYKRVVPNLVDDDTFWCRYFFRVHKLMQQESVRANLVKRAISIDDEEELSWDVDDDDEDEHDKNAKTEQTGESEMKEYSNPNSSVIHDEAAISHESFDESSGAADKKLVDESSQHDVRKENATEFGHKNGYDNQDANREGDGQLKNEGGAVKEDEKKRTSERKDDQASSSKDGGALDISSQQAVREEEEELGWDEIEDIGSGDDNKATYSTPGAKQNCADVRKRLSAAEVDEDLSWDIEDDD